MRAIATIAAVLAALSPVDAALLRATPSRNVSSNLTAKNASADSSDASEALDAVMSMVGSIQAQQEQEKPHPAVHTGNGTRPKLDVGFTQYEQNLTQSLVAVMGEAVSSFDNSSRDTMIHAVTNNVSAELKLKLKPLKQAIGKTWMVLPEDGQEAYAAQLKQSFQPVFADSLRNVENHIRRCKTRVDMEMRKHHPLPKPELMETLESFYISTVALDRCYGGNELIQMSLLELFDSSETVVVEEAAPSNSTGNHSRPMKKFCLNSLLTNLASRLNDQQGLLSMTMRFEAHAPMDMIQTQKSALPHHKLHLA